MSVIHQPASTANPPWVDPNQLVGIGRPSGAGQQVWAQGEVSAQVSKLNVSINIRSAANGYVLTVGNDQYIAKDADEIKGLVLEIMVKAKLSDAS